MTTLSLPSILMKPTTPTTQTLPNITHLTMLNSLYQKDHPSKILTPAEKDQGGQPHAPQALMVQLAPETQAGENPIVEDRGPRGEGPPKLGPDLALPTGGDIFPLTITRHTTPVSYTHLTLPTIYSV